MIGRKCNSTILSLIALPLFLSACRSIPKVECTTNLGFGFRRVVRAEPSSSSFESIGHFEYLYYHDRTLCELGSCSVSPPGNLVIFQDGPSGNLFLFRRSNAQLTQLTSKFVALVGRFEWRENENAVEVNFVAGNGNRTFKLP